MIDGTSLRRVDKTQLLQRFSELVDADRRHTATLLAFIAEIDRRKLYLELAYPSMFAFCVERFGMSEAIAAKRIRGGRAAGRFPCVLGMVERGELHLSGLHQLASHLTQENHEEILRRARHRSMREIDKLIAEISPKPDVPSSVRALPVRRAVSADAKASVLGAPEVKSGGHTECRAEPGTQATPVPRPVPLSPRRYKLQVTMTEETHAKLEELQALLSHQIPDGDPAKILDRALDALLTVTKKKRAAVVEKPRASSKRTNERNRVIPARVRREVFARDDGKCTFVDEKGHRCGSRWKVELHHRQAYARGGGHEADNITLRCRGHNQYEAELDFGEAFMREKRAGPG